MTKRETNRHRSVRVDFRYPISTEYEQSRTEPSQLPSSRALRIYTRQSPASTRGSYHSTDPPHVEEK